MAIAAAADPEDVVQTFYLSFLGRAADPAARDFLTRYVDLARIMHEGWRAWSKPLSGNRIRMRPLNPAGSGDHARQS